MRMPRFPVVWILIFCVASSAHAWEATEADLEEAFFLWATPRVQFHGPAMEEARDLLMKDPGMSARLLPKFMSTPSGSIRDKLITITEQLGPAAVGAAFRPHAGVDSPQLGLALFCLSRSGDTESLPILLQHLRHPRPSMRSTAALSCGYLRDNRAVSDLLRVLASDTERAVRKSAAFAIGQCADSSNVTPAVLDTLIAALGDDFFGVRFNAARSLASLSDPALSWIQAAFTSMSDTARYGAAFAAGRMSSRPSLIFLEDIAADTAAAPAVRGAALRGILDRRRAVSDTDWPDLRSTPIGRGMLGLTRP